MSLFVKVTKPKVKKEAQEYHFDKNQFEREVGIGQNAFLPQIRHEEKEVKIGSNV